MLAEKRNYKFANYRHARAEQKAEIMRSILEKAGPDSPAQSIAFSLPTTEVAGFGFRRETGD